VSFVSEKVLKKILDNTPKNIIHSFLHGGKIEPADRGRFCVLKGVWRVILNITE
jgi:hypothetical protein